MKGAAHHDNRHDNVTLVVQTGDTEPWHISNGCLGDILNLNGNAIELPEYDVLDVTYMIAIGQVLIAAAVQQPDTANVYGSLADCDVAAADVDIGIARAVII